MSAPWTWPVRRPSSGRVTLRAFRPDDVTMLMDMATDPYVPLIGSLPDRAGRAEALTYIERQHRRLAEKAGYSFVIADGSTDVALGGIGLWLWDLERGRASLGYMVAPRARGRGAAGDAVRAITEFAWTFRELHRIEAFIEPANTASIRTVQTAGFEHEGVLRSYMEIGGRRRDMAVYSRVRRA